MSGSSYGNRQLLEDVARAAASSDRKTPPPAHDAGVVHSDVDGDLIECFARAAETAGATVLRTTREDLIGAIRSLLKQTEDGPHLLEPVLAERYPALRELPRAVTEPTTDQIFEAPVGLVFASAGLAETGSVVRHAAPDRPRAFALTPMTIIVVLEAGRIVPELYDHLASLDPASIASEIVAITGPSKSADIGMKLVTGVHGPGIVRIVLIEDA